MFGVVVQNEQGTLLLPPQVLDLTPFRARGILDTFLVASKKLIMEFGYLFVAKNCMIFFYDIIVQLLKSGVGLTCFQ